MKFTLILMSLFMSLGVIASTDTKTFFFDGSEDFANFRLYAEETHTEYRYEERRTICHRQEVVYRTVCRTTPDRRRICERRPHYRTVSYPCTQTVRIPYEVKDFDVEADVQLKVLNSPEGARETFKFVLNGGRLSLEGSGSKRYFLVLKNSEVRTQIYGQLKVLSGDYEVELVEASGVLSSLELSNMSLKNSVLSFKTQQSQVPHLLGHSLEVKKAPLLGSDTTLFNRELSSSEIQISGSEAKVDFAALGIELSSGRYTITSKVYYRDAHKLLNAKDFASTDSSRTLIYKIR